MTSEAPELLPCPFCGGRGLMSREPDLDGFGTFLSIQCVACRGRSRPKYYSRGNDCPQTYQEVRDEWNTRADLHQQAIAAAYDDAKRYLTGDGVYAQWDRKQYPPEFLDWLKTLAEDIGDSCPKEADSALRQALAEAEARGYARAVETTFDKVESLSHDWGEDGCAYIDRDEALTEIRALSPTPADPVAEAARVLADHMKERRWQYYPIEMPLTKDGQGPATLGDDAVSVSYEVWEAGTLRAVSSHECLPDAIEAALRALAQKEGE